MRQFKILLTLAIFFMPGVCRADFETAANAYRTKNYPTAFAEFMTLAKSGDPRAQTVIAMMYKYGESVPANPEAAFHWYQQAANAGYGPALFNVGEMYAQGLGVNRDMDKATTWLTKAARAGFKRANKKLEELGAHEVSNPRSVDESVPWSKSWNFRLPNSIRQQESRKADIVPGASYRVQVGAMTTRAGANRLWDALTTHAPALFQNVEPIIVLSEKTEKRVYRVQTGPFDDLESARGFCQKLRRTLKTDCLTIRQ